MKEFGEALHKNAGLAKLNMCILSKF